MTGTALWSRDVDRGYRDAEDCGDCGAKRVRWFNRGTYSFHERPSHYEGNCIQHLRLRIEALEEVVLRLSNKTDLIGADEAGREA